MRFVTNFNNDQTAIYLTAIKRSGELTLSISPIARIPTRHFIHELPGLRADYPFDETSHVWDGNSSLWDSAGRRDLSAFWKVFDQVKLEMTTIIK